MTGPIVERVLRSTRYRDVDRGMLDRLAAEELPKARNADDAVKRVKRRLHQAVGAFRGASVPDPLAAVRAAWSGDLADPAFRAACIGVMRGHASTAERLPYLERLFSPIWELTGGPPSSVVDLGCGLGPLALPWMGLDREATYHAVDVDGRALAVVDAFLEMVRQPHETMARDLGTEWQSLPRADVALLFKLIPTLARQRGPTVALLDALRVRHAVVTFPLRSLGRRTRGMELTYRRELSGIASDLQVADVQDASIPNELVFVLTLRG
jgi:16S rRNA (guanine(1405)-N(7))-methyltransferase